VFSVDRARELSSAAQASRRRLRGGFAYRLYKRLLNANPVAERNAHRLLALLDRGDRPATILEVGGGTPGPGSDLLRAAPGTDFISFDVYASPHVDFLADAHEIPLADGSVDAVWIQAVLEHVIDPRRAVEEIRRVLRDGGLVYAETPFMQQVHEGAFDFTRFTHSGHRWLFRDFSEVASGEIAGAGSVLHWSIRYFFRTLTGSDTLARIAALPFFWLRFFDARGPRRKRLDAASAFYFLGRKSPRSVSERELIAYYDDAPRARR